jgi:hypothetical protein
VIALTVLLGDQYQLNTEWVRILGRINGLTITGA